MAIIPFRQLGNFGVNADTDPFSFSDPRQWTTAVNCRFRDGVIWRGPRFRQAGTATNVDARIAIGYGLNSGGYEYLLATTNGSVFRWSQKHNDGEEGVQRNLTPGTWLGHNYDEPYTWCEENNVIYLNREDRPLWFMTKGGKGFEPDPSWDKHWRCKAIRALQGEVIAIGCQKDGLDYPTMVLSSDYTTYDQTPDSWVAQTTNSASSNVLAEMPSALIDGCVLSERMYLYGTTAVWVMEPSYDTFIYRYRSVFENNAGIISQNCVVAVGGMHYVFSPNTIYSHNGQTMQDLVDGVIRRKIFDNIVLTAKNLFFVTFIPERNEVMFCYVSSEPECAFPLVDDPNNPPTACNRAAVYNLKNGTWSFDDLPYIVGAAYVSCRVGQAWNENADTWAGNGSKTWYSLADHTPPTPLFVTRGVDAPIIKPISAMDDHYDALDLSKYAVSGGSLSL